MKKRRWTLSRRKEIATAYLFLLPFIITWVVWSVLPLIQSLNMSLYDFSFIHPEQTKFIGIGNYKKLFANGDFWIAVRHTIQFVVITVPVTLAVSLPIAGLLNSKIRARTLFRTAYYMPNVISSIAVATVFMYLFVQGGICTRVLHFFGFPDVTWFTDVKLALPFVMMIYIWQVSGFYIVIYLSGLQTISPDLTEAAKIDGADHIQIFFRITIPLLKPTLFFGMTYSIISAFQVFDQIVAVSQNKLGSPAGATSTMVTYFYANAFQYYDMGYCCAAAIVLFILIMFVSVVQKKLMNDGEGV